MNLTHEQEMKLSELLHPYLDMGCWHEWTQGLDDPSANCTFCNLKYMGEFEYLNPTLFSRSTFLDVFDAVKNREGFDEEFLDHDNEFKVIPTIFINTPVFQLAVLRWLLEKDGRLGELEEVMK